MSTLVIDDILAVCNMLRGMILVHVQDREAQAEWFDRTDRIDAWIDELLETLEP